LCQPIIALMPPHDTYIETHLGGGAIMQRKPPALRNIGIDRNQRALERSQCPYPVQLVHGCAHRFLADYDYQGRSGGRRQLLLPPATIILAGLKPSSLVHHRAV
jgi:hypothetical protein